MIDPTEVLHVARLARLKLDRRGDRAMAGELSSILDHIEKISELDLDGVPPTATSSRSSNGLRADVPGPCLPREVALAQAPARRTAASSSRARRPADGVSELLDLTAAAGGRRDRARATSTPPSCSSAYRDARGGRRAQRVHLGRRATPPADLHAGRAAARRAARRQGPVLHRGRPEPGRLEDPRGLPAAVHGDVGRSGCRTPARRCSARPTRTSSRWARRTRTPPTGRC